MAKHKPPATPGHTGCTHPKKCVARRCTNGCGELEHKKPAELPEGCLWHDLARGYVEGGWCGPGLIVQLRVALGRPSAARRGEGGTRNKPGSRPPGWNADASALLADIHGWSRAADVETLRDWRRQARTILGFAVPSIALDNVSCFVCGERTLRVARDADSDVWCSAVGCHNDEKYPCLIVDDLNYEAVLGYGTAGTERFECRRTERSLTHSHRWARHSWAPIWNAMQAEKRATELEAELRAAEIEAGLVVMMSA
jgi:hypothetical protein